MFTLTGTRTAQTLLVHGIGAGNALNIARHEVTGKRAFSNDDWLDTIKLAFHQAPSSISALANTGTRCICGTAIRALDPTSDNAAANEWKHHLWSCPHVAKNFIHDRLRDDLVRQARRILGTNAVAAEPPAQSDIAPGAGIRPVRYDVTLTLPDGKRLAVDIKTYNSTTSSHAAQGVRNGYVISGLASSVVESRGREHYEDHPHFGNILAADENIDELIVAPVSVQGEFSAPFQQLARRLARAQDTLNRHESLLDFSQDAPGLYSFRLLKSLTITRARALLQWTKYAVRKVRMNARDDTLRRQISLTLRPGRRVDDSLRVDSSLRSAMRFVGLDRPICRTHLWRGRGI